jgi:hypothetical protein
MQSNNDVTLNDPRVMEINYRTMDLEVILGVEPHIGEPFGELEFAVNWFIDQFHAECWPEADWVEARWAELADEDGQVHGVTITVINPGTDDIRPWQLGKVMAIWDESGCGTAYSIGPTPPAPKKVWHPLRIV